MTGKASLVVTLLTTVHKMQGGLNPSMDMDSVFVTFAHLTAVSGSTQRQTDVSELAADCSRGGFKPLETHDHQQWTAVYV